MAAIDSACELARSPPRLVSFIVDPSTVLAQGPGRWASPCTTARGSLSSVCTVQVTSCGHARARTGLGTVCIGYAPGVSARAFLAKKWRGHWFWRPSQSLGAAVLLREATLGEATKVAPVRTIPGSVPRRACSSVVRSQSSAASCQPTTRRENASRTNAKNTVPFQQRRYAKNKTRRSIRR
jgi:hypothetical protein